MELENIMKISCNSREAQLFKKKYVSGIAGKCIYYNNQWISPNEFVELAESIQDYKLSIMCLGKPLQFFINNGQLPNVFQYGNGQGNLLKGFVI